MANYLVTGGCGFIGSHLVENLLEDGHQVRILDDFSTGKIDNVPSQCDVITGDVADSERVRLCMRDMDGCFHLAAIASVQQSNEEWIRTHQVNLTGTINVFNAAKEKRTPVVYASSAAVYGDNADIPLKESSVVSPLGAYGADKLGSELHARVASLVHGVPTTGMRFFNVYGPRQNPASSYSGVISIFVDRVTNNQALTIFGDGEQTRDFIYVGDVVRFLRASMKNISCTSSVFNVCTGETVTINQLAKIVMSITASQVPVTYQATRKGDIRVSVGDPEYAQQVLSVAAKYPLARGLKIFIDYFESPDFDYMQYQRSG
ncbi:MAG: NAD-dependent epimerase/dehydratase family protein [Gammaproteobacteria bacterium]|nr:NAD-dependent epimerase/dehydratase family protein [Gammaproteobacteria bacterium]